MAPTLDEYVPAMQLVQTPDDDASSILLYVPAIQLEQVEEVDAPVAPK
jgi:hypothetical protein